MEFKKLTQVIWMTFAFLFIVLLFLWIWSNSITIKIDVRQNIVEVVKVNKLTKSYELVLFNGTETSGWRRPSKLFQNLD